MGQRVEEEALTLDDKAAVRDRLERCVVAIEEMVLAAERLEVE